MNTTIKERGYYEFTQDNNLVVLVREDGKMPAVSEEALKLLKSAREDASHNADGWSIYSWDTKVALIQRDLLKLAVGARNAPEALASSDASEARKQNALYAQSVENYVWEAIEFLDRWVYDVYPFRDNRPEH